MTTKHGAQFRLPFKSWLYHQRNARNGAIRDIAHTLMADACLWNEDPRQLGTYRKHLLAKHQASAAALEALRKAYEAWEQYQREVRHVR